MRQLKTFVLRYRQSLITFFVLGSVGFGIFGLSLFGHSTTTGTEELAQITSAVGNVMILPTDETPTLATVQDISKLKNQAIFARAQDGDRVLMYTKAQEMIVYRPSIHKIVDVGPLITGKQGSPYVTSNIAILNGSGNNDLLNTFTRAVVSAFPNATIVQKDAAPRLFPSSIAIDLTQQNQALDEQVADTLGIKTGQLPLGISVTGADMLLIIGQDYH